MVLLYLFRIISISFFILITNVNILNAQNKDFSDTKCNFSTGKYYKELSDLASLQNIDIKVNDYKKWTKNNLGILTSAKDWEYTSYLQLNDSNILNKINFEKKKIGNFDFIWRVWNKITDYDHINQKYKKKFKAKITVQYDFGTCVFDAKIRQTGDMVDHINYSRDGIRQSLSIQLKEGNISNVINFKLFNRLSRTSDREILATLLLKELDFLAPRTRFVNVTLNGIKNEMLFQESPVKEFLEKNLRREAPVFEGDETLLQKNFFRNDAVYNLSLSKLENKNWALKGNSSLKMTLKAYIVMQNLYMEQKAFSVNPYDQYNINIDSLTKVSNQTRQNFYEHEALVLTMGCMHALSFSARKYYWNPLSGAFEPIYYDGSCARIFNLDTIFELGGMFKHDDPYFENEKNYYFSEKFLPAINSLISKVNKLDEKNFVAKAKDLCMGDECIHNENITSNYGAVSNVDFVTSYSALENYLPTIKSTLQDYKNKILKYSDKPPLEKSVEYDNKEVFDIYKSRLFTVFPNSNLYFIDMKSIGEPIIKSKKCNKVSCIKTSIDAEMIVDMMKSSKYGKKKQSILGGIYNEEVSKTELTYIDVLNTNIKHSLGSKVIYNNEKRKLEFHQKNNDDWFLLSDVEINNLTFEMISNPQSNITKLDSQNFNEFGLTGCLNFYQVDFIDTKIKTVGGACEDSVNIIKSSGQIKDINILNASSDALDVDFSNLEILNMNIANARNDCFDVSTGKYFVNNAVLKNCGDKGFSIGEASDFKGLQINVSDTKIGISSKDSSVSNIQSFLGKNIDLCFEAYQKKQEFFGAQLFIKTSNCSPDSFQADKNSFVVIEKVVQ